MAFSLFWIVRMVSNIIPFLRKNNFFLISLVFAEKILKSSFLHKKPL